jgi:flagellar assembly protein FliH
LNFQTIKHAEDNENLAVQDVDFTQMESEEDIIEKARVEAEIIIKEAKYEADRIVKEAERTAGENAKRIEEEAGMKGFEEAFTEVKKQYEDLIEEAEYIREHARVEYNDVIASIESDAVNIILDVAKKVIGTEINSNRENILYLIKQAFEKCSNKENVILKVSPEDYEFVCDNKDRLLSMIEGIGELEIKKDSSLKVYGCIVETPLGSIDASLQTKLKKIEEAFRDIIKR